ncbi:MAG: 3-dehydroquinate synthase family protein [Thermoanaerobaculia bacterium]
MTGSDDVLRLRHAQGETRIVVGEGCLARAVVASAELWRGRTVFLVSSPLVLRLQGSELAPLRAAAGALVELEVPDGESAKCLEVAGPLWETMARAGGKRDSVVVAFGGGSVGDLAGFVAATFLRGVAFVQFPTTLLAQVDAAIGGKTAIDIDAGKNLVGAFHQPELVVAESRTLTTLPRAELRSGLVEAIKMAALLDLALLARIERDLERLLAGDPKALAPVVLGAAAAKVGVVERDPFERGERQLLNYGHTFGHALEAAAGFGRIPHGDAVAWGMRFSHRLALRRGADADFLARVELLLDRLEVPLPPPVDIDTVIGNLARDKKARESGLVWVLPMAPGRGERNAGVEASEVASEVTSFLSRLRAGSAPV